MKKGFFEEKVIRNEKANEPWNPKEEDRLIDLYLAGTPPARIATMLHRNPKSIERRLEGYTANERDLMVNYRPQRRVSRKGQRLTQNELFLMRSWTQRNIPAKAQARFLMRDVGELGLNSEDRYRLVDMKKVGVGVDLVMAYRYLYYCKNLSILSDQAYDTLEKEETEFGAHGELLKKAPSSDREADYPPHIRALGLYLAFKYGKRKGDNGLTTDPSH